MRPGILDGMVKEYQSWASSPASRAVMQANRRRDTAPELAVRRLIHAAGLRYRVDAKPIATLNRRADLVFRRAKVAVFVDGCYWHGCPRHGTAAAVNREYWSSKIARNRARDRETDRLLGEEGWRVLRFWEHEEPRAVSAEVIRAVRAVLRGTP
jgi:DNA mismatch endonuclease, patch repair protein